MSGLRNAIVVRPQTLPRVALDLVPTLPKYYSAHEVRRLIDVGLENSRKKERDQLLFEILWQTGLRVSELLSIGPRSIDFRASALAVVTLKRRRPVLRVVPLQAQLLGRIATYIGAESIVPRCALFPITRQAVDKIVRKAARAAELPDDGRAHAHTLRHSFAVHAVLSRVPVLVLNEWLGHARVENTLVYTRVVAADSRGFYEEISF